MKLETKQVLVGLGIVAFVMGVILFGLARQSHETISESGRPIVRVGYVGPLTGNNATIGQNYKQGIEFALSKLQDGPIEYRFIPEDDQLKLSAAVTAANKLVNVNRVNVLIAGTSTAGNAVTPIVKRHKIPMIAIASDTRIAAASPYNFTHWTPPVKEAEKMVELLQMKGVKRVLLLSELHVGMKAISDPVKELARKAGIEVREIEIVPSERSYTDIIQKAVREKADMWMLLLIEPGISIAYKRMKEQRVNVPYTSIEVPGFTEDKAIFEGVVYVDATDGDPQLVREYQEKYGTKNVFGVFYAYDSMMILDKFYTEFYEEHQRLPTGEELTERLLNLQDYSGAVGPLSVDRDGVIHSEAVFKTMRNGEAVPVETP